MGRRSHGAHIAPTACAQRPNNAANPRLAGPATGSGAAAKRPCSNNVNNASLVLCIDSRDDRDLRGVVMNVKVGLATRLCHET